MPGFCGGTLARRAWTAACTGRVSGPGPTLAIGTGPGCPGDAGKYGQNLGGR